MYSIMMQESLCADAASFDLPSWLLSACITEAKNCVSLARQRGDQSSDKTLKPDDFAILRGKLDSKMFNEYYMSINDVTFDY